MAKTVIGLMDNLPAAQAVVRELGEAGMRSEDIGFMANQKHEIPPTAQLNESEGGTAAGALAGAGIGAVAGGLIGSLTRLGVPEEEAQYYAEAVRRGGILVTVAVDKVAQAATAVAIMKQHGAVDIDQRSADWKKQGWEGRFEAAVYARPVRKRAKKARPAYTGPERRVNGTPWLGEERRRAA